MQERRRAETAKANNFASCRKRGEPRQHESLGERAWNGFEFGKSERIGRAIGIGQQNGEDHDRPHDAVAYELPCEGANCIHRATLSFTNSLISYLDFYDFMLVHQTA